LVFEKNYKLETGKWKDIADTFKDPGIGHGTGGTQPCCDRQVYSRGTTVVLAAVKPSWVTGSTPRKRVHGWKKRGLLQIRVKAWVSGGRQQLLQ
jgi:hypothetical protein